MWDRKHASCYGKPLCIHSATQEVQSGVIYYNIIQIHSPGAAFVGTIAFIGSTVQCTTLYEYELCT